MTITVDTVGTRVRVASAGFPPEWNLAPVASIGPDATSAEATPRDFGSVASVAFGPDEQVVYVTDRKSEVACIVSGNGCRVTLGLAG